jgi:hypothetical protein
MVIPLQQVLDAIPSFNQPEQTIGWPSKLSPAFIFQQLQDTLVPCKCLLAQFYLTVCHVMVFGCGHPKIFMHGFIEIRVRMNTTILTYNTASKHSSLLDILTKSFMDSYDACMLHVRRMHAYLALDCWVVHSDEYTSAYILPSLSCNFVPLRGFACFLTITTFWCRGFQLMARLAPGINKCMIMQALGLPLLFEGRGGPQATLIIWSTPARRADQGRDC